MPEDLHTEYKEARSAVPKSLFDTVCAFLNTDGGTVYLGIDDDGYVTGVNPEVVTRLKREIAGISNDPQKLDPPYLLFHLIHTFANS